MVALTRTIGVSHPRVVLCRKRELGLVYSLRCWHLLRCVEELDDYGDFVMDGFRYRWSNKPRQYFHCNYLI